ncbi:hypothetical protein [Streptomyces sp. NPDC020571]|uniref:hypothetical protein n=1 Tax=Streptomyces sp. NPDC020571 TaxID=3365079 RepID=UPI0037AAF976
MPPYRRGGSARPRRVSADGFGTAMLGHFALTGLLLDTLAKAAEPRVIGAEPERRLRAATGRGLSGGQFFGPAGFFERRGRVTEVRLSREAADPAVGKQLWSAAEELTGVRCL